MGLDENNSATCPRCGAIVPSGNAYCGTCGASVPGVSFLGERDAELGGGVTRQPTPRPPKYERKFSTLERMTKLLTSPEEAMEDIGQAPDYGGVLVIFSVLTIISFISLAFNLQKIQFTGPYGDFVNRGVAAGVAGTAILVPIVLIVRWMVKSYLIRHMSDSKLWDFETAASVTGYAYFPSIILSIIGTILVSMLMPSIVIDTTDLAQATLQMEAFAAQTLWISVGLNTVISIIALLWKSYLGSHGTYYGTHKKYDTGSAFGTFLIVGGIGFILDFISNFL